MQIERDREKLNFQDNDLNFFNDSFQDILSMIWYNSINNITNN